MPDAITPYNFVPIAASPLPSEAVPPADRYDLQRHTGWFSIDYTTYTPTYTRAARRVDNTFPHAIASTGKPPNQQPADFFHRGDIDADGNWLRTPVLPGSSLRGMFRSVFEIMTCSNLEFVSKRHLFFRSFMDTDRAGLRSLYQHHFALDKLIGGIIGEDAQGLYLRVSTQSKAGFIWITATEPLLPPSLNPYHRNVFYEALPIWVDTFIDERNCLHAGMGNPPAAGRHNAFLIVPGKDIQDRQRYQAILDLPGPGPTEYILYRIPDSVYDDYQNWGRMAHGQAFNEEPQHGQMRKVPRKLRAGLPAFALRDPAMPGAVSVIGGNMMMALRYSRSIDAVAQQSRSGDADMARAVFGCVDEEDATKTIRSRIFVEDAICVTANPWMPGDIPQQTVRIPDILSGPKPTAFQTYLEQNSQKLTNWESSEATIRGFKRYWHRPLPAVHAALRADTPQNFNANQQSSQRTRIRPVREKVVFIGRIRFENLTPAELGALYASIHLPAELAHSFGMGKNLGLGALHAKITQTVLLDMAARCRSLLPDAGFRSDVETQRLLQQGYTDFVWRVDTVCPNAGQLWHSDRMQALAGLMSRDCVLPHELTRQIPIKRGQQDNFAHNCDQWRQRSRLPSTNKIAADYLSKQDRYVPIPRDVITVGSPPSYPVLVSILSMHEAVLDGIQSRLNHLKGAQHTEEAERIVRQLAELPPSQTRNELAQQLWTWIQKNVKRDKHGTKDWYSTAEQLAKLE